MTVAADCAAELDRLARERIPLSVIRRGAEALVEWVDERCAREREIARRLRDAAVTSPLRVLTRSGTVTDVRGRRVLVETRRRPGR